MVAIIPINKQTKFSQQSLKGRDGDVIAQYDHLCYTYENYTTWFPNAVVVLILKVIYFLVKHFCLYNK